MQNISARFTNLNETNSPITGGGSALNKPFYNELLHIIGLEETKEKGKVKITRKAPERRSSGALIELAVSRIEAEYSIFPDREMFREFGETKVERIFNIALELCIVWINRILFLKLLEAQLVSYHQGNKDYYFLNAEKIATFNELYDLFHEVLAKQPAERIAKVKDKFACVSYLNSSLFDFADIERLTICVSAIDDNVFLEFAPTTALKDVKAKNQTLPTLEYLLKFLDRYDFGNVEKDENLGDAKRPIINASVLGKIFEKINGYREGSIYTPALITMYMCREAIRPAVVQKFNDAFADWNIETFAELKIKLAEYDEPHKILEFNEVINSIKICDPAVGSGHFLVSALNEILAVKYELGLLADANGERFNDYHISVVADELYITDLANKPFKYEISGGKPNPEAQHFQKTLFHETRTIIENCLFGVDINPNSVRICRLRLWIELLKNAYYKEPVQSPNFSLPAGEVRRKHAEAWTLNYTELETLPNIKEGNSLISRFALDFDLKELLKTGNSVKKYREKVFQYKTERSRDVKAELLRVIEQIKNDFTEIEAVKSNAIYKNAFEWRFEFPEVLDNEGNFQGFDIIIGNPPYIDSEKMVNEGMRNIRDFIAENYTTAKGNWDIYIAFIEKGFSLLKASGGLIYITPDKWLSKSFGNETRSQFFENIKSILVCGRDVFESALVDSIITFFIKKTITDIKVEKAENEEIYLLNQIPKENIKPPYFLDFLFSRNLALLTKLETNKLTLSDFAECENACATSDAYKLKPFLMNEATAAQDGDVYFQVVNTGTIGKYLSKWGVKEMTYLKDKYLYPAVLREEFRHNFTNSYCVKSLKPKIIIKGLTLLDGCIDVSGTVIPGKSTLVITGENLAFLKFVLAVINSKLSIFYISERYSASSYNAGITFSKEMINNLPVPEISPAEQKPFIKLVDEILALKKAGKPTAELENKVDEMIFDLYDLDEAEREIVKGNNGARVSQA